MKKPNWAALAVVGALAMTVGGCKGSSPQGQRCVGVAPGVCAGVELSSLGSGTYHTDNANCSGILYVREGATGGSGTEASPYGDLPQATAMATAGDCIALAAGSYTAADLPGSVSLLGKGAGKTTVTTSPGGHLAVQPGSNALIRGLRVTGSGQGITVNQSTGTTLEQIEIVQVVSLALLVAESQRVTLRQTRIAGVTGVGGEVGVGVVFRRTPETRVEQSLIEDCEGSGMVLLQRDATTASSLVQVTGSVFRNNAGYGVAASCTNCQEAPTVEISGSQVENNVGVGIWLLGVQPTIHNTLVSDSKVLPGFFTLGRGIEVVNAPDFSLTGNTVERSGNMGVFVYDSSGLLDGNTVADNEQRGIWIQQIDATIRPDVVASNNIVMGNNLVGLGAYGRLDVQIQGGEISNTLLNGYINPQSQFIEMGDGIQILTDSHVSVSAVTLADNPRAAILVDGASPGVTLAGNLITNDEENGIIIQNVNWDPIEAISNNSRPDGSAVGAHEPSIPLVWDTSAPQSGLDPGASVGWDPIE